MTDLATDDGVPLCMTCGRRLEYVETVQTDPGQPPGDLWRCEVDDVTLIRYDEID